MERVDGYLVIDNCDKKLADKDKGHYWVYIDGVEYYFKPDDYVYNELVGYYAAKFLGIDACFCDLAILDGEKGVISKSLRNNKVKLVSGDELLGDYLVSSKVLEDNSLLKSIDIINDMGLGIEKVNEVKEYYFSESTKNLGSDYINNLEIIWQALEFRYGKKIDIKEVMNQFVLMYFFTIIFSDIDKLPGNWFIQESKDGIKLAPLFDNGDIFLNYSRGYDEEKTPMLFSTNFKDTGFNLVKSLKTFFKTSSSEYLELFVSMFDKIENNFEIVLNMVEKQIGRKIPDAEVERLNMAFNKNCQRIESVIDSFKTKKQH